MNRRSARHPRSNTLISAAVYAVVVALLAVLGAALVNFDGLLGTPEGSVLPWLIPILYVAAGLAGIGWGLMLSRTRPRTYATLGAGPEAVRTAEERSSDSVGIGVRR